MILGRKIAQIAVNDHHVFVLCNDGTVWVSWRGVDSWAPWEQLPTIPYPAGETTED